MLQFLPPNISDIEKKIRSVGTATLPSGNSFWFEDIPQIPAKLQLIPFQVISDRVGEPHELWINGALKKRFVPQSTYDTVSLAFNPGIYDAVIKNSKEEYKLTFQISVKELFWWAWIQQIIPAYQNLNVIESKFNSPLHIMAFEMVLSPDLSALQSTQYAIRNYARSAFSSTIEDSALTLASGVFDAPVKGLERKADLLDRRADFSQLLLPMPYQCASRRTSFLASTEPERITNCSWGHATLEGKEVVRNPLTVLPPIILEVSVLDQSGDPILEEDIPEIRVGIIDSKLSVVNVTTFSVFRKEKTLLFTSGEIDKKDIQDLSLYLFVTTPTYDPRMTPIPLKGLVSGTYNYTIFLKKNTRRIIVNANPNSNWRLLANNINSFNFGGEVQEPLEILNYRDGKLEISVDGYIAQGYIYYCLEGYPRNVVNGNVTYNYARVLCTLNDNSQSALYPMSIQ